MSIPEVGSKNRLLAFLQRYLKKVDSLQITGPLQVEGGVVASPSPTTGESFLAISGDGSGASAHSSYDNIVVDSDSHAGISVLTPDDKTSAIFLGSPADNSGLAMQWFAPSATPPARGLFGPTAADSSLEIVTAGSILGFPLVRTAMFIDSNQAVTTPYQPVVFARRTSSQVLTAPYATTLTTVIFDSLAAPGFEVGNGDDYDHTTGVYTAGATSGKYSVSANVMLSEVPIASTIRLACLTTQSAVAGVILYGDRFAGTDFTWAVSPDMSHNMVRGTWIVELDATESMEIQVIATAADAGTYIYGNATAAYTCLNIFKLS